jgi:hypothetical protein
MKPAQMTVKLLATLTAVGAICVASAHADGDPAPTYQRERAMQKYKSCHWTDEMGKYVYECIKRNDGFATHWCYDETLEHFCPEQIERAKNAASQPGATDKPAN